MRGEESCYQKNNATLDDLLVSLGTAILRYDTLIRDECFKGRP